METRHKLVLLIDDHPLFRLGLLSALSSADQRLRLYEAATLPAALTALASNLSFDLIVYDWRLDSAGGGGVKGLLALLQTAPGVPVVVVSALEEEEVRMVALDLGAVRFVSKRTDATEVRDVVLEVLRQSNGSVPSGGRPAPPCMLTPRQHEVLRLMAKGLANKLIADELEIMNTTVRAHVSEILRQMNVKNRVEAVVLAYRTGMV